MNSRFEVRQKMRLKRRLLDNKTQRACAEKIARRIDHLSSFRSSQRIACYLAHDGEANTEVLINRIWRYGKLCYIPILNSIKYRHLFFAPYLKNQPFRKNKFGILEPDVSPKKYLAANVLDLVFVPLVAFDAKGNRVGMGGGFYDTSFAFLRHRKLWHKPKLIGLAYEFQKIDTILSESWDIPLDGVITEKNYYSFSE